MGLWGEFIWGFSQWGSSDRGANVTGVSGNTMQEIRKSWNRTSTPSVVVDRDALVRVHSRVDADDENVLFDLYITAATEAVERECDRQLMNATYVLRMDQFPVEIRLPKPPCLSVTSIVYTDTAGDLQTLDASSYSVDVSMHPARIVPAYGETWPPTYDDLNAVTVTYQAGYSSSGTLSTAQAAVPADLRLAVLHCVAHWFETREPVVMGGAPADVPLVAMELAKPYWHGFMW